MSKRLRISWPAIRIIVDCVLLALSSVVDATDPASDAGRKITRAEWLGIAEDVWALLLTRGLGVEPAAPASHR